MVVALHGHLYGGIAGEHHHFLDRKSLLDPERHRETAHVVAAKLDAEPLAQRLKVPAYRVDVYELPKLASAVLSAGGRLAGTTRPHGFMATSVNCSWCSIRPEIPLHTNGSENDIRCQATKRKGVPLSCVSSRIAAPAGFPC